MSARIAAAYVPVVLTILTAAFVWTLVRDELYWREVTAALTSDAPRELEVDSTVTDLPVASGVGKPVRLPAGLWAAELHLSEGDANDIPVSLSYARGNSGGSVRWHGGRDKVFRVGHGKDADIPPGPVMVTADVPEGVQWSVLFRCLECDAK